MILVLSGKGGVGKSTVSTQIALSLQHCGFKVLMENLQFLYPITKHIITLLQVGLLDIDLCGPSIPKILGLEKSTVYQCPQG